MFGAKISSVLAGGILVLGSSAIALAQAGGPPEELPQESAQEAQDEVSTLELDNETATDAVENRGQEEGDGDGTEFSNWVKSLELDGCERGLTIAANAKGGPTDFDPENAVDADPGHPAFTNGNCTDAGENEVTSTGADAAEQGQSNRPSEAGEQGGRDTADDARSEAGPDSQTGADAAEQGRSNRPGDADEQGGRDRAPDRP